MDEPTDLTRPGAGFERYRPIVDDWPAFVDALARPLDSCVWVNTLRTDAAELLGVLREDGLDPRPLAWRPDAFRLGLESFAGRWWYAVGLCHAQEEASMVPVRLLDPRPGDRVLDLCAAPGGKTAQIAVALGNRGTVVANDLSGSRLRALRGNLDRLGIQNVTVTQHDGANYPKEAGWFDRILVDAPCSGEGTLRRQTRKTMVSSAERSSRQLGKQSALLAKAARLLRPGGRLVYSTCTFAPEENEAVVDTALRAFPEFDLHVVPAKLPGLPAVEGIGAWDGRTFREDVRNARRIWPHHGDTGGFFVAVIEKRAGGIPAEPRALELREADYDEWRPYVVERFGIPERIREAWIVHRRNSAGLHAVDAAHQAPAAPTAAAVGLRIVRDRITYPKLSTAAAMVLAGQATRNVVDLDAAETRRFLAREALTLIPPDDARCTGTGYVLARHRGFGLGVAFYDAETRLLRSQFPKRWGC